MYAVKEDPVITPPVSELQHQREDSSRSSGNYSSISHVTGGSEADVGGSQGLSLSSESLQKGVSSPLEEEGEEEEEEDDDYEEEEDDLQDGVVEGGDRFGSIEGLKWGEFVQFKLPREDEVRTRRSFVLPNRI